MRVLFIYPDVGTLLPPDYQHGVGTLMAVLKKAGHDARLIYAHDEYGREELIEEVREIDPGLLAVSSVSNQYPRALRYSQWIKEDLGLPILIGGMHATLSPDEVIAEPCFDALCRGEGEGAIVELAGALEEGRDYSGIDNLWVKRGGEVRKNPLRPLIEDLGSLPFVDREGFRFEKILEAQEGKCSMLSGRGCPYGCTYCANEGIRHLYKGKGRFVRMRPVSHVLSEMAEILKTYDVKKWEFNDDIFTLKKEFLNEFCERYPKEFTIPFDVNVRVETVGYDELKKLKDAGCDLIRIGVESGSERVRRELMGRPMKNEQIEKVFEYSERVGLKTWSFNMVGLPGETEEDALQTLRLNEKLCPDHMQVSVFNPYPGTKLYDAVVERGISTGRTMDGYFLPHTVLDMPEFPPEKINEMHQRLIRLRDQCTTRKRMLRELRGRPPFFDFVERLLDAEVQTPEPIFVGEDYFWIGEDARRVLRVHPDSKVRYKLRMPAGGEMRFSLAMHPQVLDRGEPGGVDFIVRVGRLVRTMKPVFEKRLDPKAKEQDRGWHDYSIDISPWAGKKVYVEFETRAVNQAANQHNTVGFGYPMVLDEKSCSPMKA